MSTNSKRNANLTSQAKANLVPINYTPASTGNTANLNQFVIDPNGKKWFIDFSGNAILLDTEQIQFDKYKTTSTTCADIVSTGNVSLTVETGLAYTPLQDVIVYADANNHMHGEVVSYNSVTGALVINVHQKEGSGNFCNWTVNLDAIKLAEVSVYFGSDDPITLGQTGIEGDLFYVTNNGLGTGTITETWVYDDAFGWVRVPMSESLETTSLTPLNGNGTAYVAPTLDSNNKLVDVIQLSDGKRVHNGKVKWVNHKLPIHTYFYASATAPYYTATEPSVGYSQQLFYTEDADTIHIDIEQGLFIDPNSGSSGTSGMISQIVNRGTEVVFGNIKFRTPATGDRYLQVATTTATALLTGQDTYKVSTSTVTSMRSITATTTFQYVRPTTTLSTIGESSIWLFVDRTNQRTFRVSFVHYSATQDSITIERLN